MSRQTDRGNIYRCPSIIFIESKTDVINSLIESPDFI